MLDEAVTPDSVLRSLPPSGEMVEEREDSDAGLQPRQHNIFHSISSSVEYMMESLCSLVIDWTLFWCDFMFQMLTFPFDNQRDSFTRVSTRSGRVSMLYSHPDFECGYQTIELTILSIFLLALHLLLYHLGDSEFFQTSTMSSTHNSSHYQPGIAAFPNPFVSATVLLLEMLQDWLTSSVLGGTQFNASQYFTNETHKAISTGNQLMDLTVFEHVEQATISLILPPIVLGLFLLFTVMLFLCGHILFLCILWLSRWLTTYDEDNVDDSTNFLGEGLLGITEYTHPLGPIFTSIPPNTTSENFSSLLILFGLIIVFLLETVLPLIMLGTGIYICLVSLYSLEDIDHKSVFTFSPTFLQIFPFTANISVAAIISILLLSAGVCYLFYYGIRSIRIGIYRTLQDGVNHNITMEFSSGVTNQVNN